MNAPGPYLLLADIVLFAHFLVVAFIAAGFLVILWGRYREWRWIHDPVFRGLHLGAITIVALQAWLGRLCPLTTLESGLREKAGQAAYTETFIQHWLHQLLFFDAAPWIFTTLYSILGALVFAVWLTDRIGKTDT
jgi:hypothetical protein